MLTTTQTEIPPVVHATCVGVGVGPRVVVSSFGWQTVGKSGVVCRIGH